MMNKRIILHIGMPKTGTSAIQAFLKLNVSRLKDEGILYPSPSDFGQAYQTSSGNGAHLKELLEFNKLDEAKKIIQTYPDTTILISNEGFFDIFIKYPERIFEVLDGTDFRIICYVRRQDNLFSSVYKQNVKNHGLSLSINEFDGYRQARDFEGPLFEALKYTEIENIIVKPYEQAQFVENNIYNDFMSIIGVDNINEWKMPFKVVNPSLDRETLEFRRILNKLKLDSMSNEIKIKLNSILSKYTVEYKENKGDYNTFSLLERRGIIEEYEESNKKVADTFLSDGKQLFIEELPLNDPYEEIRKNEFSLYELIDLCQHLIELSGSDEAKEKLEEVIVQGTVSEILYSGEIDVNELRTLSRLNILQKKPKISDDISEVNNDYGILFLNSIGDDPYIILNDSIDSQAKELFLRIQLTAPETTMLQVFYRIGIRFDRNESVSKQINEGFNEVILRLPNTEKIKDIRIDPGNVEGVYGIISISLYESAEKS